MNAGEIDLSWGAATDNVGVTGYQIWRCQGAGCTNFAQVAQPAGTGTTYQDTGLAARHELQLRGPRRRRRRQRRRVLQRVHGDDAGKRRHAAAVGAGDAERLGRERRRDRPLLGRGHGQRRRDRLPGLPLPGRWLHELRANGADGGHRDDVQGPAVAANTSYSYEVRAFDAAGNTGPFSNVASGTTTGTGGLVAAYAFDEGSGATAADASGNGNTGTVTNATWAAGRYGSALSFNGASSLVSVPNSSSLQLSSGMTLEAWVNPSTVSSAWRDVIYKGNDNYYLEGTSVNDGKPDGGGTFGGANANAYGSAALTANAWSYVALTYDGATLRLYVNGTLAGSQAKTGAIATSTNPLQIGGDSIWGQFFSGLIDEVRIYNLPEPLDVIQHDMNTPVGSPLDMQPPSAPGTLTGSAPTANEVDLSWGAATDNVGVTGYQIWRCQGAGCTNFAQLAQVGGTGTTYSDLTASGTTTLQLRGPRHRRFRQPGCVLQHLHGDDAFERRHAAALGPGDADRVGPDRERGRPELGRGHRQRRRHRLPDLALSGRGLHELRPARAGGRYRHDLLRPHRLGDHDLQLRGPRHRRFRQPGCVLQRLHGDDAFEHRHAAAVRARAPSPPRTSARPRSISAGAPRPTTSASPATASTAARAPAAPTSRTSSS